MKPVLAVDIGGTHIRVAVSRDGRTISDLRKFPNPGPWKMAVRLVAEAAKAMVGGKAKACRAAVVGLAGPVDTENGVLLAAPNLKGWAGKPIAKTLSRLLACPVRLENDAVLGAIGEARLGSGKKKRRVAYITVGTGIGGALVVGGLPVPDARYEPGHQLIGDSGDFESLVSGAAFRRRHGVTMGECRDRRTWKAYADDFARGLVNVAAFWSPDVIVIGGGAGVAAGERFLPMVPALMRKRFTILPIPPIQIAKLGDDAGLYGALELLKR